MDSLGKEVEGSISRQDLPTKWDTSVSRALKLLVSEKRVRVTERRLASLEECAAYFPDKTLSADLRKVRQDLLPTLFEWPERHRRYSTVENEQFHFRSLTQDEQHHLASLWENIEPQLVGLLPDCGAPIRNQLFLLIAYGKSLFESEGLKTRKSFGELIAQLIQTRFLSASITKEFETFRDTFLDKDQAGFLRLKSEIRSIVDVPERGRRWSLKKNTVELLEQNYHKVLADFPGYEPGARSGLGSPPVQSQLLNKLFDHLVYRKFRFLKAM